MRLSTLRCRRRRDRCMLRLLSAAGVPANSLTPSQAETLRDVECLENARL